MIFFSGPFSRDPFDSRGYEDVWTRFVCFPFREDLDPYHLVSGERVLRPLLPRTVCGPHADEGRTVVSVYSPVQPPSSRSDGTTFSLDDPGFLPSIDRHLDTQNHPVSVRIYGLCFRDVLVPRYLQEKSLILPSSSCVTVHFRLEE